jgi:hypothetical protein
MTMVQDERGLRKGLWRDTRKPKTPSGMSSNLRVREKFGKSGTVKAPKSTKLLGGLARGGTPLALLAMAVLLGGGIMASGVNSDAA